MDAEEITGRLRLAKPHSLRVYSADREDADLVAVSTKRDRWKRCNVVLDAMSWTRIECLSKNGEIIDTLQQDDESVDADGKKVKAVPQSEEERWLNLMINAQRLALENHAHMLQPLIDGYVRIIDGMGVRESALEQRLERQLEVAYENAVLQAQVDAGPDSDTEVMKALIEKWSANQKPKPALRAKPKAKPKTNGATNVAA